MYTKKNAGRGRGVGLGKEQSQLVVELIATMRQMQSDQAQIIKEVLVSQQKQSDVMSAWMGMFKAPEGPNQSSGLDERLLRKEDAGGMTDWEPMNPAEMLEIVKTVQLGN